MTPFGVYLITTLFTLWEFFPVVVLAAATTFLEARYTLYLFLASAAAAAILYFLESRLATVAITGLAIYSLIGISVFIPAAGIRRVVLTLIFVLVGSSLSGVIFTSSYLATKEIHDKSNTLRWQAKISHDIKQEKINIGSSSFLHSRSNILPREVDFLKTVLENCNFQSFDDVMASFGNKIDGLAEALTKRLGNGSCRDSDNNRSIIYKMLAGMSIEAIRPHIQSINSLLRNDIKLAGAREFAAKSGDFGSSQTQLLLAVLRYDIPNRHDPIRWAAEGLCRIGPDAGSAASELVSAARARRHIPFDNALGKGYTTDTDSLYAITTALHRMRKTALANEFMSELSKSSHSQENINKRVNDFDRRYCDIYYEKSAKK